MNCELLSCDINSNLGSVVPLAMFEYNLGEATERDWERFSAMLESVSRDFGEETRNEDADTWLKY